MTAGHALVLALGPSAGYRHGVQAPALVIAVVIGMSAVAGAFQRLLAAVRDDVRVEKDWVGPALSVIHRLGMVRAAIATAAAQLAFLVAAETLEQHAAGVVIGGLAGLVGSPLLAALPIHLIIGAAAGMLLWLCAQKAPSHAAALLALARIALSWLARRAPSLAARPAVHAANTRVAYELLLAHKLASRPPPQPLRRA